MRLQEKAARGRSWTPPSLELKPPTRRRTALAMLSQSFRLTQKRHQLLPIRLEPATGHDLDLTLGCDRDAPLLPQIHTCARQVQRGGCRLHAPKIAHDVLEVHSRILRPGNSFVNGLDIASRLLYSRNHVHSSDKEGSINEHDHLTSA